MCIIHTLLYFKKPVYKKPAPQTAKRYESYAQIAYDVRNYAITGPVLVRWCQPSMFIFIILVGTWTYRPGLIGPDL